MRQHVSGFTWRVDSKHLTFEGMFPRLCNSLIFGGLFPIQFQVIRRRLGRSEPVGPCLASAPLLLTVSGL